MERRTEPDDLTAEQSRALTSPLRIEIVGLFAYENPMSIADMAARMGVRAGSLYHHVGILERVGLLRRAGTRRKGKRDEALFALARTRLEVPLDTGDAPRGEHARRAVGAAFRMAERDLAHALRRDDAVTEGERRNMIATRIHFRASPRLLARINKHVDAILDLLAREGARRPAKADRGADDPYLSLTLALLPLESRRRGRTRQARRNRR